MKKSSLKVTLTVLFLLAGVVPVIAVSITNLIVFNNNIESEIMNSLSMFANFSETRIEDCCSGIKDQGQVITCTRDVYESMNILQEVDWDVNSPEWEEREKILDDLLKNAAKELGFARMFITNPEGEVVYDTGKDLVGRSLQKRDYVQAALKGSRYWSSPFFSDIINENCLVYSSPVLTGGSSGNIAGTNISGTMNILLNDEIVGRLVHDGLEEIGKESIDSYLVDAQGLLITDTCLGEYTANAALNETINTEAVEILSEAITSGNMEFNTQARYKNYLGQAVLGNLQVTRLGDTPVGLIVEVEQAEVFQKAHKMRNMAILIAAIMAVVIILIGILMANSIARPMQEIVAVASGIAQGNLLLEAKVNRGDEIGQLGEEFNIMSQGLRQLIRQVVDVATGVNSGSEAVSAASEEMSSSLQEVSATINEFASNVQQLSGSSQEAAEINHDILKRAEEGRTVIEKAVEHMEIINKRVHDLQEVIGRVDQRSHDIGQILTVITDIADQTNLLALNAAIEAARAGEQGRGFAVVAEEVRKLAEQSAKAAAEIGELIQNTQMESKQALENMNLGVKEVQEGTNVVVDAGSSFRGIIQDVEEIGVRVEETASAIEELSASSEELAASAQEQSSTMEEVAASAEELRSSAENMFAEMRKFKYQ
ncbi:MAG TPA: HAMP domain-containing protein [Firmicutes bacterium]|nr:HAMP domain-containing protein [Bacillota bacterium]